MTLVLEVIGLAMALAPIFMELSQRRHLVSDPMLLATKPEKHRTLVDEFYGDLSYEMTQLHMTVEKFVMDLSIPEDVKEKLVNPGHLDHLIWKNPEPQIQDIFQSRLGACTESFLHSMDMIFRELSKLVEDKSLPVHLGADRIRHHEASSYPKLEEMLNAPHNVSARVKFAFNREKRRKRIDKIAKYNERLRKMLESSDNGIRSIPTHRKIGDCGIPHLRLRERISEFRKMLARVWCKCTAGHDLRMGLFKSWKESDPVYLDLVMNLSATDVPAWAESKVHIDMSLRSTNSSKAQFASSDGSTTTLVCFDSRTSISISGETFTQSPEGSPPRPSSIHSHRAPSSTISFIDEGEDDKKSKSGKPRTAIGELCAAVSKSYNQRLCSQLSYEDGMFWSLPYIRAEKQSIAKTHPGTTLQALLNQHRDRGDFKLKHRKILQVIIARSLLFYPWTEGSEISKESVYFFGNNGIDLSRPFAPIRPHLEVDERGEANLEEDEELSFSPNGTLASVATLLLELESGKTIESLQTDEDLDIDGNPTSNTKYFTTMRYVKENLDNMYGRIHGAIEACLHCDFELEELTLNNEDFRSKVYEQIVLPLEQELETAFPRALEDLTTMQQTVMQQPTIPKMNHSTGLGIQVQTRAVTIAVPVTPTPPMTPPSSYSSTMATKLPPSPQIDYHRLFKPSLCAD